MSVAIPARLTREILTMPMAAIGAPSAMPRFRWQQPIPHSDAPPVGLSAAETSHLFNWGADSILPYQVQENYGRRLQDGELAVFQLENARFRIQIAPQLGGRLLSIFDKRDGRDLIFNNPVLQPANLAALNAWFSGGIEWNGLTPGHSPTTCSPIFVDRVDSERGPVLRLFEFDRTTECVWQIDLFLPEGEAPLAYHGRIINPNDVPALVYWWTNLAIATPKGGRVLAPTDYVIEHVLPDNHLERFETIEAELGDGSYLDNWLSATSVFFRNERPARNLIAVVDDQGLATAHLATPALIGRKFFYFGTAAGGQHWMDFLSRPDEGDYLEIQAGITPTQNQRFAMPAKYELDWTGVILPLSLDTSLAHAENYRGATDHAEQASAAALTDAQLQDLDLFLGMIARRKSSQRLAEGAAWGRRYEQLKQLRLSENLDFSTQTPRDYWDDLADGRQPAASDDLPDGFALAPAWLAAMQALDATDWRSFLYRSIAALDEGQIEDARQLAEKSLAQRPNWLTFRQLALTATDPELARHSYLEAWQTGKAPAELAVEIIQFLQRHFPVADLAGFLASLPEAIKNEERIQLAEARLAAETGNLQRLEELLSRHFAQIREGETVTEDLWQDLIRLRFRHQHQRPPERDELRQALRDNPIPAHLDFRMLTSEPAKETVNGTR